MSSSQVEVFQQSFKQMLKKTPYPQAIVDKNFDYIAVSNSWCNVYGLEEKNLIGTNHYKLFPEILDHEEWMQIHKRALNGEEIERQRDKFERADGSIQFLEWRIAPWFEDKEEWTVGGAIMFTKDITDQVEYERKIEHLNENLEKEVRKRTDELEHAKKSLEAFSYSVSHDLRAPLRAINGFSQVLREEYEEALDEEGLRLLNIIQISSRKMGKLIDDVLEFSRVDRKTMKHEKVDMKWLTEQVILDVEAEYSYKEYVIDVQELPEVYGSLPMLRQLIENLISNAFKYSTEENVIKIEVGYEEGEADSGNYVFYVKDNGIGLDEKYSNKIFGVFERLHSEKSFSGTGVGLAIAKKIVNKHGGRIWVESVVGNGASFFFSIPKNK